MDESFRHAGTREREGKAFRRQRSLRGRLEKNGVPRDQGWKDGINRYEIGKARWRDKIEFQVRGRGG